MRSDCGNELGLGEARDRRLAMIEIETGAMFGGDIVLRESPQILPDFTADFSGPVRS